MGAIKVELEALTHSGHGMVQTPSEQKIHLSYNGGSKIILQTSGTFDTGDSCMLLDKEQLTKALDFLKLLMP